MSMPFNANMAAVFRSIADLIERTGDPSAEVTVWTNGDYASIEMRSRGLDINALRMACGGAPLEADQTAQIERERQAIRERSQRGEW